jgi:signal transduction histidine kinase
MAHVNEVCVAVTNEGAGIPAADRERVFSRFYRSEAARASRTPGLGLGLYVSREIIRAHGGRMWVESIPDKTTTFSFTLPISNT